MSIWVICIEYVGYIDEYISMSMWAIYRVTYEYVGYIDEYVGCI